MTLGDACTDCCVSVNGLRKRWKASVMESGNPDPSPMGWLTRLEPGRSWVRDNGRGYDVSSRDLVERRLLFSLSLRQRLTKETQVVGLGFEG